MSVPPPPLRVRKPWMPLSAWVASPTWKVSLAGPALIVVAVPAWVDWMV